MTGPPARDPLDRLRADPRRAACLTAVRTRPARPGERVAWPAWVPPAVRTRLVESGIEAPWRHQARAAEAAWAGRHVVLSTGTASGKSLGYLLPALSALVADPGARVLYLAPTKALAGDQLRAVQSLGLPGVRAATLDGDTDPGERDWVRAHATYVLSNPDMLSRSLLPRHRRWAALFGGLRYVVVDECHAYRGVFGSGVAQVLRRLHRVCAAAGSSPTFVLASATVDDPAVAASRLVGLPVEQVTDDASPRGPLSFALYEPPLDAGGGEHGAPVRRPATAEVADLLADFVAEGVRTLAFVRSRRGAETVAAGARRSLADLGLDDRVASYRSGYLPEERRALERDLQSGRLLGMAATSALELGLDVSGLDAVLITGWPGTVASLWQQAGRAGRGSRPATAIFVARDDPLDTYLVRHPEALLDRPVEATVLDPDNPYVLGPHLECAAAELPLTGLDLPLFGPQARPVLDALVAAGRLRARPSGWYWTSGDLPQADLRGTGGDPVRLVEAVTGRLLGTVDAASAGSHVHPGAVYLHQGSVFVVDDLDLDAGVALLTSGDPGWTTFARDVTDIAILSTLRSLTVGGLTVCFGDVAVTHQVVGYLRRDLRTGQVLGETPLDLPPRRLETRAVWYVAGDEVLAAAGVSPAQVPGAAHAAEHAAIGLLPLFATCDRWDIGGVSTAAHPDTGAATVFVHDGHPGGAGFAERGFTRLRPWLAATAEAVRGCECPSGCPSCVQSPKCGNANSPLDKAGALRLLDAVVGQLSVAEQAAG